MGPYCRILHANLASLSGEQLMMAAYASEDVLGKEGCNRRGGAVYPLTVIRLKALRRCVGRGKP
eukprot:2428147-Pleurochrysis_carterae.AAC.1